MRNFALLLLITCLAQGATLDEQIQAKVRVFPASVSIFAKNLDSGAAYSLHGDGPVRTASTIKLALMVEVFAAIADGRAQWADTITVREEDKVSGSGVVRELSAGLKLPIRDLVNLMIVVSDNTATNLLIDKFTADAVNARMEKLGFKETRLMRKVRGDGANLKPAEGWSIDGRKPENQKYGIGKSTPHEMVTLLERLDRGELINAEASKQMMDLLKRQQYLDGIGRRTGKLTVASKSGSLDALRSDVGIVYSPGGRVAIAITVDGMKDLDYSVDNAGSMLIAELSRMLIQGLAK